VSLGNFIIFLSVVVWIFFCYATTKLKKIPAILSAYEAVTFGLVFDI